MSIRAGWLRPETCITGRYVDNEGYIQIKVKNHYLAGSRRIREHRLVMAEKLGRMLLPTEVVHHKNSDKSQRQINHPDGLEVLWKGDHTKLHGAEISRGMVGKKLSEEHKVKLSIAHKGNKRALGYHHTEAMKQHLSRVMRAKYG